MLSPLIYVSERGGLLDLSQRMFFINGVYMHTFIAAKKSVEGEHEIGKRTKRRDRQRYNYEDHGNNIRQFWSTYS